MASSLLQPYLSPKTLISSKNQAPAFHPSFPSLSLASVSKFKSFSLFSSSLGKNSSIASSGFARKVAVSSEFEQEEDVSNDEREANFSRDLKLFVGNLPFNVDSAELAGLFGRAGNVEMVEVIYDKLTGRSRGFGFVTMSTADEVEAAAQQFNGYELEGRALRVNSGPPPPKDDSRGFRGGGGSNYEDSRGYRGGGGGSNFDDSRGYRGGGGGSNFDDSRGYRGGGGGGGSNFDSANKVYVGNLSWSVDDSALEGLFSEQGKVTEARVVYDRESGRSRGFGFVTYSSTKEANGAISQLNGVDLDGRSIRVTMAESKPRRQF